MVSFDETKRWRNFKVHGFDFIGAETILDGNTVTREDRRGA